MIDPPFRSPRAKLGGLHHLGRMLDKLRCDLAGSLPEEYRPNLGLSAGLDGFLCGFLGVKFEDVRQKISEGLSDDEVAEWCFTTGLRPNPAQRRIWNAFSEKLGWRDLATSFVNELKKEEGLENRPELQTAFDIIDEREGRGNKE
ncbi:MAG: DUF5069 domain-containing protein [Verrucomicrobia bacterium]|nr:DUF5069 domain-containing protein [Verrucomicrobiota bacterium]